MSLGTRERRRKGWRHEADSPFDAITKISRILDVSTMPMMSIHNRVSESHRHNPFLEASQEHLGDQVVEKMVCPWKHSSLSPKRNKYIIQKRAFVVVGEGVARCKGCAEKPTVSPGREARDASFM